MFFDMPNSKRYDVRDVKTVNDMESQVIGDVFIEVLLADE